MIDDINKITEEKDIAGGKEVLHIILTLGLHIIYWYYSIAKKFREKNINDKS